MYTLELLTTGLSSLVEALETLWYYEGVSIVRVTPADVDRMDGDADGAVAKILIRRKKPVERQEDCTTPESTECPLYIFPWGNWESRAMDHYTYNNTPDYVKVVAEWLETL